MNDPICTLKNEILDIADVITAAVVKRITPVEDEITARQAWREYGRTWLENQQRRGRIEGRRKGVCKNSPIVYSRTELLALKEAERRGVSTIIKNATV